jgi:cytidylate kinase
MILRKSILTCIALVASVMVAQGEITEQQLSTIFQQHCATLKNLTIEHKPLLVAFSGTPGMGKSFVAKKLEDHYQAVRISTDLLRKLIESNTSISLQEYEGVLHTYLHYFFGHYDKPNKRFILDASIDRKYVQVVPFCAQHKINLIVVRLEVPRDIVVKRLCEREGAKSAWHRKHLDAWFTDYYNFANAYKNYVPYANVEGANFDQLIQAIDKNMDDSIV